MDSDSVHVARHVVVVLTVVVGAVSGTVPQTRAVLQPALPWVPLVRTLQTCFCVIRGILCVVLHWGFWWVCHITNTYLVGLHCEWNELGPLW